MNSNIPRHVAIIMDGNGRWAQKKGLPRIAGHEVGVQRVEEIIEIAPKHGVQYLTLYAFSKENWQRPPAEVTFLMDLLGNYLDSKMQKLIDNNVIFNTIGDIKDLPARNQEKIARLTEKTRRNTGLTATFAFSYSSRFEITDACRKIAEKAAAGSLKPQDITEAVVAQHLNTAGLPDPDLLVRTSGEMRISNFLLWQISYAELYVTDKYWPDFNEAEFAKALEAYQKRERRFGGTERVVPK
jgi:undecaprenyl diphosphate synthase